LLDNKLHLAPVADDITHVLDIGTGTGIWVIEFAHQHPSCDITGTDLSPIQPDQVPSNVRFVIDDAEEQWAFNQKFDYVHVRVMIISDSRLAVFHWAGFRMKVFVGMRSGPGQLTDSVAGISSSQKYPFEDARLCPTNVILYLRQLAARQVPNPSHFSSLP
jgi:SAM-dependent methyltransferase